MGSYFTRGTSRDEYAVYTEDGNAYKRNMDRLLKKWDTAKHMVPGPQLYNEKNGSKHGLLFFGTSQYAVEEAMEMLGMPAGPSRPPLTKVRAQDLEDLKKLVEVYRRLITEKGLAPGAPARPLETT